MGEQAFKSCTRNLMDLMTQLTNVQKALSDLPSYLDNGSAAMAGALLGRIDAGCAAATGLARTMQLDLADEQANREYQLQEAQTKRGK